MLTEANLPLLRGGSVCTPACPHPLHTAPDSLPRAGNTNTLKEMSRIRFCTLTFWSASTLEARGQVSAPPKLQTRLQRISGWARPLGSPALLQSCSRLISNTWPFFAQSKAHSLQIHPPRTEKAFPKTTENLPRLSHPSHFLESRPGLPLRWVPTYFRMPPSHRSSLLKLPRWPLGTDTLRSSSWALALSYTAQAWEFCRHCFPSHLKRRVSCTVKDF